MKAEQTFKNIIAESRQILRQARAGADCPSLDDLQEYAANQAGQMKNSAIEAHVRRCDNCRAVVSRIAADTFFWDGLLARDPGAALAMALGDRGRKLVRAMIKKNSSCADFVSKIKEAMVAWTSPQWQPHFAGVAVTAADVEEQSHRFEMEYGEYINLSCHWREEKDGRPYIDLAWQANLMQPAKLWARFIDPDSGNILTEILLGTELEGKQRIMGRELNFNPSADKWAIAIVVEE